MHKRPTLFCLFLTACLCVSCRNGVPVKQDFERAEVQTRRMLAEAHEPTCVPRTINDDGSVRYVGLEDWTSGFFAGTLWQLFEHTQEDYWRQEAEKWTWALEPLRYFRGHHDVGFMIGCSFGNYYRLTGDRRAEPVIMDAARSLSSRFHPSVGLIQSWETRWFPDSRYPVIIDNMMNLELLFLASKISGDLRFHDIAVSHADKTLENHYREDFSSWHVVDYDPVSGQVLRKCTSQGFSDESAWARGQAWGLYGFTMCFRETGKQRYLEQARRIASFMLNHPNVPEDGIFYWDFDAPLIPDEPRDVSAACITASALLELAGYLPEEEKAYFSAAEKILKSLSAPPYISDEGANGNFILTNSVGAAPARSEMSVPLNYADYYFLEALNRYSHY